ncbi:MAG: IS110 family transposase [Blautia sp.]|nr:IS110 family transposase [Blautia sp.]
MAAKNRRNQRKHLKSGGSYSSEELRFLTMEDGTRVVYSADGDIRRPICAGIDVHKEILMAAICKTDTETLKATFFVRKFTTRNSDIRSMAIWLKEYGVEDVCMESTGKYWIPVFNILEQNSIKPILTHPKYVKQAKGQKTDFRDAIHMASLFRMDLVVASFIPPAEIRDLRELCRYRLKLTYMRTSEKNRFQNSMTISKVRLDSVFSDPFGKSASAIMEYLIFTEPDKVSDDEILKLVSCRRNVKASDEEILDSIHGYEFIGVQRDKLQIIGMHLSQIEQCIDMVDEKLEYYRQKYAGIIRHLTTMVGITSESALYILGEIGTDMSVWWDDASLACWAGLSPANNASAGKKKSTKVGNGGHYLKPLLVQCALAAVKSTKKDPYFHNKYETLKKRRGHKKAIIAIARKMLVAIYHMIKGDADFHPIDYENTIQNIRKTKGLNLNNVIAFLKEQGADESTIELIETQCSGKETEIADRKEKQSTSGSTDASQSMQESVNGNPVLISGSQQSRALNHQSKDPAVTTATA